MHNATTCLLSPSDDGILLDIIIQQNINYMDIAMAIASFLTDETTDDMIFGIQVKLTSSLEELRRFGFSIERLRTNLRAQVDGELFNRKNIYNKMQK